MEDIKLIALALYRKLNSCSRAVDHTTWCGSTGVVRRATCIYCRCIAATSAAKYPETKSAALRRIEHGNACAERYLAEQLGKTVREGMEVFA